MGDWSPAPRQVIELLSRYQFGKWVGAMAYLSLFLHISTINFMKCFAIGALPFAPTV